MTKLSVLFLETLVPLSTYVVWIEFKENKKYSESADTSTSMTLTFDLDLASRKLMSLDITYCFERKY